MTQRICVTGAAGFVGSHVCEALLRRGDAVIGIDNFDPFYGRATKERWRSDLESWPLFEFVELDVRNVSALSDIVQGVDCVIHLAARAGVRQSFDAPAFYAEVNVGGTAAVIESMARVGVQRLVFASSSSVYGRAEIPFREHATDLHPVSPYGVSKWAAEQLAGVLAPTHGLSVAILRLFSVYGPRQRPDQVATRLAAALRRGQPAPRFGDGTAMRDFTYVTDATAGIVLATDWTGGRAANAEIFNIGTGHAESVERLIELMASAFGEPPAVQVLPAAVGDVPCTRADISKARAALGYEPTVSLEAGIARFTSWCGTIDGTQP